MSAKKVFINYRRSVSQWAVKPLYDSLIEVLPRSHVFIDLDAIPPGVDFVDYLDNAVKQCDVLLAVIGIGWLEAADAVGHRRLDDPNDFVRIEIRQALKRDIPVVPLLLDGVKMPSASELPEDIRSLARRNAEFIQVRTAKADIERLIRGLKLFDGRAALERERDALSVECRTLTGRVTELQNKIDADRSAFDSEKDAWAAGYSSLQNELRNVQSEAAAERHRSMTLEGQLRDSRVNQSNHLSEFFDADRRTLLFSAVSASVGVLVTGTILGWGNGGVVAPADVAACDCPDCPCGKPDEISAKLRVTLQYVERSTSPGKRCDNCLQYIRPSEARACGGCKIFTGPVVPAGYCLSWAAVQTG